MAGLHSKLCIKRQTPQTKKHFRHFQCHNIRDPKSKVEDEIVPRWSRIEPQPWPPTGSHAGLPRLSHRVHLSLYRQKNIWSSPPPVYAGAVDALEIRRRTNSSIDWSPHHLILADHEQQKFLKSPGIPSSSFASKMPTRPPISNSK